MINIVPEINYWLRKIITNGNVHQDYKQVPLEITKSEWVFDYSILQLLLDINFSNDIFNIYYRKAKRNKITDKYLKARTTVIVGNSTFWISDIYNPLVFLDIPNNIENIGTSIERIPEINMNYSDTSSSIFDNSDTTLYNIFDITYGEYDLLHLLFMYNAYNDILLDFNSIVYNNLQSDLSKLIYCYLDCELNNDYTHFNSLAITDERLLVKVYAKYLIEHFYLKTKLCPQIPQNFNLENSELSTIDKLVTETEVLQKEIILDSIPLSNDSIYLVYNSEIQKESIDFKLITEMIGETLTAKISWSGYTLENKIVKDSKIYIQWGNKVNTNV